MDPGPSEFLDDYFRDRHGAEYEERRYHSGNWQALLNPVEREALNLFREDPRIPRVHLRDALESYLKSHDKGQQPKFAADTRRALGHVLSGVGDYPLGLYKRAHANTVRESLL